MSADIIGMVAVVGAVLFFGASVVSWRNYRKTAAITHYWLSIAVAALLGAVAVVCEADRSLFGCSGLYEYNYLYMTAMAVMLSVAGIQAVTNRFVRAVM